MSNNGIVVWQERVPARLSWDEWTSRVHNVGMLKKKIAWYIGDLLNYGLDTFGERAWQEIEAMGYSEGALSNFKYVAKKFPPEERSGDLPWSFYQACAGFPKKEREKLITQGLSGALNRAGVRALAAASKNGNGTEAAEENPLVNALVLVGKLLSRESKGDDVIALLEPALDTLVVEAMKRLEQVQGLVATRTE